jgi:hypothetical protein
MFSFLKHLTARIVMLSTTTVVTLIVYIATAVAVPDLMRFLQNGVSHALGATERTLSISSQYMVWAEMADVNSKLVFIMFYITTFFILAVGWAFLKRTLIRTVHTTWTLIRRPFGKKNNV